MNKEIGITSKLIVVYLFCSLTFASSVSMWILGRWFYRENAKERYPVWRCL